MEEQNPGRISIRDRIGRFFVFFGASVDELLFLGDEPKELRKIYGQLESMSMNPNLTQEQRVDALRTLAHLKVSEMTGNQAIELFEDN